ncbi:MAG: 50S ribosomal protein L9 [Firmicutes bacterium]|nr:50S ribosomal protein L9 [Bacillota bacterium]
MKVILLQDVKGLGRKNDVVDVAEGYGRNYLIPRGLALLATDASLKQREQKQRAEKRKREREEAQARETATKLEARPLVLKVKAGEGGKLFGSVTAADIARELLQQHGANVDKRRIELDEPIKSIGTYEIAVRLHPGVQARLKLEVLEESS